MSIQISCDMYLRFGLHVQIRLYCVLPYKAKISSQHGIDFILDRCIVYLGLAMPNLQKKHLLIFEICTLFFGTEYIIHFPLDFGKLKMLMTFLKEVMRLTSKRPIFMFL